MYNKNRSSGSKNQQQILASIFGLIAFVAVLFLTVVPFGERLRIISYVLEIAGNTSASEDYAEQALKEQPNFRSYAYHFWLMARHKKESVALQDLDHLIELKPQGSTLYMARGFFHHSRGEFDAADNDYSESLKFKPDSINAHLNRSDARLRKHEYEAALADCNEALALITKYPKEGEDWRRIVLLNRGEAYVGLKQFQNALLDFEMIQKLDPNFQPGELAYYRSLAHEGLQQVELAAADRATAEKENFDPSELPFFDIQLFAEDIR